MDYRDLRVGIGASGARKTRLLDLVSRNGQPEAGTRAGVRGVDGERVGWVGGGRAVVVSEAGMEFVRSLARKVTVLHGGSVVCEGSVDEVQKDERVGEVYLGRSRSRTVGAHA